MYSDYEVYAIVSPQLRRIYIIDFKILFAHYKEGKHRIFETNEAIEDIYLLPLEYLEEQGGIIATVDYKNPAFNYGVATVAAVKETAAA